MFSKRLKYFGIIYFFICILILHNVIPSFAQEPIFSIPQKINRNAANIKIIGVIDGGIFVFRYGENLNLLEKYSTDMELIFQKTIFLKNKKAMFENIFLLNNKIALFYSATNNQTFKHQMLALIINNEGIVIDSAKIIDEINFNKLRNKGSFELSSSKDRTKILCYRSETQQGNENSLLFLTIINNELETIWHKQINIPYDPEIFNVEKCKVDNNGNVSVLGIVYNDDKKIKQPDRFKYLVLSYRYEKDLLNEYLIKTENKFLTDVGFSIDNINSKIVVSGFYSDISSYMVAGTFYFSVDIQKEQASQTTFQRFEKEFVAKLIGEKSATKGKELSNFNIDYITLRNDGGAILIAEHFILTTFTQPFMTQGITNYTTYYSYEYGNIIIVSINPEGNILWKQIIPKEQISTNDGGYYSSYTMGLLNDKMNFIYNESISRKTNFIQNTINSAGESTFNILLNTAHKDILMIPKEAKQITSNVMLIPCLMRNKSCIAKITF